MKLVTHAKLLIAYKGHSRIYDDWLFWYYLASYKKEINGYAQLTTNNIMELTAVIESLKLIKNPSTIVLFA